MLICLSHCNKNFRECDWNIKPKYFNEMLLFSISLNSLAICNKEKKCIRRTGNMALHFNNHLTLEMMSLCKQPHFLWVQKQPLAVFSSCCLAQCWSQTWFPHMAVQVFLQSCNFHILVSRVLGDCNKRRATFKYFCNFRKD